VSQNEDAVGALAKLGLTRSELDEIDSILG
jgi:hypothetical protein